jgi:hypothetical protein
MTSTLVLLFTCTYSSFTCSSLLLACRWHHQRLVLLSDRGVPATFLSGLLDILNREWDDEVA